MYNIYYQTAPSYLCNIPLVGHSYGTRNSKMCFNLPQVNSYGGKTFKFCGIKIWNSLPLSLKSTESKADFKKSFLFGQMKAIENSEFTN